MSATNHVRVITRRADRRITGARAESHNLCGAEPTAYDLTVADARRAYARWELGKWVACLACCAAIRRMPS